MLLGGGGGPRGDIGTREVPLGGRICRNVNKNNNNNNNKSCAVLAPPAALFCSQPWQYLV